MVRRHFPERKPAMLTFDDLLRKARPLPLNSEIWHILSGAETNANDTVYLEKACAEREWNKVALDSIAVLLDHNTKPSTRAWFKRHGYVW
jgi:hypothetical protein